MYEHAKDGRLIHVEFTLSWGELTLLSSSTLFNHFGRTGRAQSGTAHAARAVMQGASFHHPTIYSLPFLRCSRYAYQTSIYLTLKWAFAPSLIML